MNKLMQFLRESYTEMTDNVSWLSFKEAQDSSLLVLVASLVFALAIGAVDFVFNESLTNIYNAF